jgi:hypothetical protein
VGSRWGRTKLIDLDCCLNVQKQTVFSMNSVVFTVKKPIIDRLGFSKFKSFGKFTHFSAVVPAAELSFDRLDIRVSCGLLSTLKNMGMRQGQTLC